VEEDTGGERREKMAWVESSGREKKKKNLFMSVVCADDACVKMNHSEERKKMNKIF